MGKNGHTEGNRKKLNGGGLTGRAAKKRLQGAAERTLGRQDWKISKKKGRELLGWERNHATCCGSGDWLMRIPNEKKKSPRTITPGRSFQREDKKCRCVPTPPA